MSDDYIFKKNNKIATGPQIIQQHVQQSSLSTFASTASVRTGGASSSSSTSSSAVADEDEAAEDEATEDEPAVATELCFDFFGALCFIMILCLSWAGEGSRFGVP
jgi:hypothetical protein